MIMCFVLMIFSHKGKVLPQKWKKFIGIYIEYYKLRETYIYENTWSKRGTFLGNINR